MAYQSQSLLNAVPASVQLVLAVIGGIFLLFKSIGLARVIGDLIMPGTNVIIMPLPIRLFYIY